MTDISVYLVQWLTLVAVFSLAVISPGPDFVMAVRNSVLHSRRTGILTALGFGAGVMVHVTYTVLGIAALIAQSILLFNILKFAGAAYLIWMGVQALRSKGMPELQIPETGPKETQAIMSDSAAFRSGFLTNLLNPKATLFFLAIFSQIIRPETPHIWQAVYGLTCAAMVVGWFSLVAFVLTQDQVRSRFLKAAHWIDRVCGVLLIGLGIKVALASR
jgi:RhtB (resistance to homoserine/threonine) family protein